MKNNIAVLIPCYNEAITINDVVKNFKINLPNSNVFVYDNNSTDNTIEIAKNAGAIVRSVNRQGKGNVVRRMFADIEADIYLMVDGDATYDSSAAPILVQTLQDEGLDMVVGCRKTKEETAYRAGHRFGNKLLTNFVALLFGREFYDILSGYRVFSKRFVKSFPALSQGFEIETELTVHALELRMPIKEIDTNYYSRPEGSASKLSTYKDGLKILKTIIRLFKNERPFIFFGIISLFFILLSIFFATPVIITYLKTGLVPRFPTIILSMGLMLMAVISITTGIILNTVTRGRDEMKRLAYLQIPL